MQVDILGQHMSVGKSLNEYVDSRLKEVVGKYFANAPSAHVHFSKQGHEFNCDVVLHEGTGRHVVIKSNASCDEVYSAFVNILRSQRFLRIDGCGWEVWQYIHLKADV